MSFNVQGAIDAGYSPKEISQYLTLLKSSGSPAVAPANNLQAPSPTPQTSQNTLTAPTNALPSIAAKTSIPQKRSVSNLTPAQPKSILQGNLSGNNLVSGNGFLPNIVNSLASPFVKSLQTIEGGSYEGARAIDAALGNKKAYTPGYKNNPFLTKEAINKYNTDPTGALMDQIKNSAAMASWGVPFGKGAGIVQKALIPGAIVGGAQALPNAQNAEDVLKGAAAGAGTAGVLHGVGAGISKLRGAGTTSSTALNEAADTLTQGTRQIRQKASIYGAGNEEAINNTLDKYGITGPAQRQYEALQPTMNKIENDIQSHIKANPDVSVPVKDIKQSFMDNLKSSLRSKDLTQQQAATEINGYLNDLIKASGGKGKFTDVSLERLRNLKKLVNDDYGQINDITARGGTLTPRQKVISAAWNSLDGAVKTASPEIKALLKDESNLYKAASNLSSARFNPPTFRFAGTSMPNSITQKGREIGGNVLKTGANIAGKIGSLPSIPASMTQVAGQIGSRLPSASGGIKQGQNEPNPENQQTNYNPENQNLPPIRSISQPIGQSQQKNPLEGYTVDGNPILKGDADLINGIANYKIDLAKVTSLRSDERTRIAKLVAQYDPTWDMTQYPARLALRKDFTSGKSASNIRSLNTAVGHLASLAQAGNNLGNTTLPAINTIKNIASMSVGQPGVVKFNNAVNAVAGEMSTVFKGASGTDQEIKSWKEQMNAAQSPEQIKEGINQMIELMGSRLAAFNSQWETGMGKPKDFRILSNKSRQILNDLGIDVDAIDPTGQ